MRRVITGHRDGKSVIVEDTEMDYEVTPFFKRIRLDETDQVPEVPRQTRTLTGQFASRSPVPGATRFTINALAPDEVVWENAERDGLDLEKMWRDLLDDEPGMHTTDTVDYDIILAGEIWLEMDDGVEVHLTTGDVVIQNGTRHAWRNKSTEDCVIATVMVGAKRET